jgi:hypothetical protein
MEFLRPIKNSYMTYCQFNRYIHYETITYTDYTNIISIPKLDGENEREIATNFSSYFLRPIKTVRLAFKFCLTKSILLYCSKIYLIKAISNTKK